MYKMLHGMERIVVVWCGGCSYLRIREGGGDKRNTRVSGLDWITVVRRCALLNCMYDPVTCGVEWILPSFNVQRKMHQIK